MRVMNDDICMYIFTSQPRLQDWLCLVARDRFQAVVVTAWGSGDGWFQRSLSKTTAESYIPDDPCMEYLATFTPQMTQM